MLARYPLLTSLVTAVLVEPVMFSTLLFVWACLKAGPPPPPFEATLVIFDRRALIFFERS